MKRTFFIFNLLIGLFMTTFALTACSSDDDEKNDNPLVGTWIVKSADDTDLDFTQITLKSNGTAEYPDMERDRYIRWKTDGNKLRIDIGEGGPDDFIIGTYTISGKTLTYSYHWEDYYGDWIDETIYTMILEKK